MRVITGAARGRKLLEPQGRDIRPTSDIVKEAMFNIIQFDIEGRRVLDLFAGTGQLGIEALSRGAESCVFVDVSTQAVKLIRQNLQGCGFVGKVLQRSATSFLEDCGGFDLIFCDPPYEGGLCDKILQKINTFDILSVGGIIVCETYYKMVLPELDAPYFKGKEYKYGKTTLIVYEKRKS